jgi:hypothetical protein
MPKAFDVDGWRVDHSDEMREARYVVEIERLKGRHGMRQFARCGVEAGHVDIPYKNVSYHQKWSWKRSVSRQDTR